MVDRIELKNMAKEQIKGKIGILFIMGLVMMAISLALAFIPVFGGLISGWVLEPAFTLSIIGVFLGICKGETPTVSNVFDGFYDLWCAFKVYFFTGIFVFLWSLLLIVPGIIKAYSYSMSIYILAENKGMPALEAIRRSKEMMEGHKMDLFVLWLSFIGWNMLGIITCGIAYIWAAPYMIATMTNFYNEIKGQKETVETTVEVLETTVE